MIDQREMDKLNRRVNNILREMMEPGADYKVVLLVAERGEDRIQLSSATSGEYGVAAWICEMAAKVFQDKADEEGRETVHHILDVLKTALKDGSLKDFIREARERADAKDESEGATKH